MSQVLEWVRNPALEEELFARLRRKYEQDRSKELHFSDTIHCLTKSYWNKVAPIPVSNDTLGMFAIGFALEDVMFKEYPIQEQGSVQPYTYEGVVFSPDYFTTAIGGEVDLKTTRMWSEADGRPKFTDDRPHGFPEAWLKQLMGYAHRRGPSPPDYSCPVEYVDYNIAIVYLGSGQIVAGTIRFAWEDVELNMAHHLHRAAILEDYLGMHEVPTPFVYNEAWECKNCQYFTRCKGHG